MDAQEGDPTDSVEEIEVINRFNLVAYVLEVDLALCLNAKCKCA